MKFNESSGGLAFYCNFLAKGQKNCGIANKNSYFLYFL